MRKPAIYAKTEVQISCAVTTQLISDFVFATYMYIVQSKIPNQLQPSSAGVQPGLCQTWSETVKKDFLVIQQDFLLMQLIW